MPSAIENEHILFGYPSEDCTILERTAYVLCYDDYTKVADWASYHLTDEYLVSLVSRTDDFRPDPDLPIGKRSELSDYRGSSFDRGHLVPAGDMKRSREVMSERFLLSNMAPQKPGFNRGIWKVLEDKVRQLTRKEKNLYVISGALYFTENSDVIGNVAVPSHFYKIIVTGNKNEPSKLETVAFIIPNDSFPSDELPTFIVTIDAVEEASGLDFLHELDDGLESMLEAQNRLAGWFKN